MTIPSQCVFIQGSLVYCICGLAYIGLSLWQSSVPTISADRRSCQRTSLSSISTTGKMYKQSDIMNVVSLFRGDRYQPDSSATIMLIKPAPSVNRFQWPSESHQVRASARSPTYSQFMYAIVLRASLIHIRSLIHSQIYGCIGSQTGRMSVCVCVCP